MENQNQIAQTQHSANLSLVHKVKQQIPMRNLKDRTPILQSLGMCFVMSGLNDENIPQGIQKDVLVNFIVDCYGGLGQSEIVEAFKLAFSGKLGLSENDLNCYQNFSCQYVGKILAAYYKWRMKEISKPQKSADDPPAEMNDEEWFKTMLIDPYERILNGGKYEWSLFQEILIFNRLYEIGFRFIMTEPEKESLLIAARKEVQKPKGLMTEDKKREYEKELARVSKGLAFRMKIQEKLIEEFDLRTYVLDKLKKNNNGK